MRSLKRGNHSEGGLLCRNLKENGSHKEPRKQQFTVFIRGVGRSCRGRPLIGMDRPKLSKLKREGSERDKMSPTEITVSTVQLSVRFRCKPICLPPSNELDRKCFVGIFCIS